MQKSGCKKNAHNAVISVFDLPISMGVFEWYYMGCGAREETVGGGEVEE